MIYLLVLVFISEALIQLPLHHKSQPVPKFPHSLRGLSPPTSLTNYKNTEYSIEAGIGNPPQNFTFLLSFKTTWITVDSSTCELCRSWTEKFNKSASLTYQSTNGYLTLDTVGKMHGYAGKDSITIEKLTARSQGIVLVDLEEGTSDLKPDGILGLGLDSSNNENSSVIGTLYNQKDISRMIFSLYLNDLSSFSDLPSKGDSMLIIDGYNISKYAAESEFTYINAANSDGYWQLNYDYAMFNGVNYTGGNKAIINPGTSLILGPKEVITGFFEQLSKNYTCVKDGQITCNCNEKYPDLVFQINGIRFRILSAGYMLKIDNYCFPAFDESYIPNTWVLGDVFLRRFYTLFDMRFPRIGFATVGTQSQISIGPFSPAEPPGGPKLPPDDPETPPDNPEPPQDGKDHSSSSSSDLNWQLAIIIVLPISAIIIFVKKI